MNVDCIVYTCMRHTSPLVQVRDNILTASPWRSHKCSTQTEFNANLWALKDEFDFGGVASWNSLMRITTCRSHNVQPITATRAIHRYNHRGQRSIIPRAIFALRCQRSTIEIEHSLLRVVGEDHALYVIIRYRHALQAYAEFLVVNKCIYYAKLVESN